MATDRKSKPFAFLSYSSDDIEDVRQIRGFLADKGLATWMAEEDIPAGADHAEEIPNAIENCDAFILILSKNAQGSAWIPKELDTAISLKKLIIPFQIDDSVLKKSYEYRLKDTQIMTAHRRYGDACVDLARKLCASWSMEFVEDTPLNDDIAGIFELPFLNSFVCQRLTSKSENRDLIKNFSCRQNLNLEYYLQASGWKADNCGETAVYLIKNKNDQILMYFAVKCGVLYDSLNVNELRRQVSESKQLLDILSCKEKTAEDELALREAAERYQLQGTPLMQHLDLAYRQARFEWEMIQEEKDNTFDSNILLVERTHPAVELVQFTINDAARDFWAEYMKEHHFSRPMGEVLFWRFIVPVILSVQEIVGCTHVFTYAADSGKDKTLTKYMQYRLNFRQPANMGTCKPKYDFGCELLCQEIDALRLGRQAYFEQFYNELQ